MVSGGRVNLHRAEQIYTDVQELRQLYFNTEVAMVLMDQAHANLVLEREVTQHHDEADLQRPAEVGMLTGLYAPGTNLKTQTMRVLSSQVVGFYDPQSQEMILVNGKSPRSLWSEITEFFTHQKPTSEMLVAHELTHALQDQYFGVHAALDRIVGDDDRRLALKAVTEGDAMLVSYGYISGRIDADTIGTLQTNLENMPKMFDLESPGTPAALRDALIFEYTDGTRFVGEAYRRGGWNAVNALYRNPPLSTRQILEPAFYFVHPSPPLRIAVGGWAPALEGWHEVAENTYGELLLRVILTRGPGGQTSAGLARGWRGDRMAVLQKDAALTVIWIVALSDDASAAAFASAYAGILDRIVTNGAAAPHHVELRGAAVLAIIGPGAAQSAELAPAIWRASVIGAAAPASAPPASPGA
ncbi:MAG TPA: hypothetical protein VNF28_02060 [Candidatus Binataceae bacterium]|nr:hypothetical protein [Candidatus Binataceae bacterium]